MTLRSFLEESHRPRGTLQYHELQGFVFAVACAPEPVDIVYWMPLIFGGRDPRYAGLEECRTVIGELINLYDSVAAAVLEDRAELPGDCAFRAQPLANLENDAPIAQWSRGLLQGHLWVEESWQKTHFPQQAFEPYTAVLLTLSYFSSKEVVEAFGRSIGGSDLMVLTETVVEIFPEAVRSYAHFGRSLQQRGAETGGRESPHARNTGRNEPCLCGSGRKYKKCCGAPH